MFKVGDKVKQTDNCSGTFSGRIYEVKNFDVSNNPHGGLYIWDAETIKVNSNGCTCESRWQLVEELTINKNNMQKLNSMLKLLLGADEKVLYKAGYINGDLKLTDKGQEALNAINFKAAKEELVKLAQEDLDEAKEDK